VPLLIGRDARRIEDTWQYLYKGAYWRRGPVTMSAISAVDTALWDLAAKAPECSVVSAAGWQSRDAVMVYGHASGDDLERTAEAVAHYVKLDTSDPRAIGGFPVWRVPTVWAVERCITNRRRRARPGESLVFGTLF